MKHQLGLGRACVGSLKSVVRVCLAACLVALLVGVSAAQTVNSVKVNPASVVGGTSATGTVNLSKKAPAGGFDVSLTSTNGVATLPASVSVPAGKTSATFAIETSPVATDTSVGVEAAAGSSSVQTKLLVKAPKLSELSLSPTSVTGGLTSTATVKISSEAPAAGLSVGLISNQSSVQVPDSVVIAGGASSATFAVATQPTSSKLTAKITATLNSSSIGESLSVLPVHVGSVAFSPTSILGGATSTGTVTLTGPAGPNGFSVSLSSSSAIAQTPASVEVQAGSSSATFTVTAASTSANVNAKITAHLGSSSASGTLTINANVVSINHAFLDGTWNMTTNLNGFPPQSITISGWNITFEDDPQDIYDYVILSYGTNSTGWDSLMIAQMITPTEAKLIGNWQISAQSRDLLTFSGGGGYLWNAQFTRATAGTAHPINPTPLNVAPTPLTP
jgi:hypothetical protein